MTTRLYFELLNKVNPVNRSVIEMWFLLLLWNFHGLSRSNWRLSSDGHLTFFKHIRLKPISDALKRKTCESMDAWNMYRLKYLFMFCKIPCEAKQFSLLVLVISKFRCPKHTTLLLKVCVCVYQHSDYDRDLACFATPQKKMLKSISSFLVKCCRTSKLKDDT